jgi:hypothetical protein
LSRKTFLIDLRRAGRDTRDNSNPARLAILGAGIRFAVAVGLKDGADSCAVCGRACVKEGKTAERIGGMQIVD